MTEAREGAPAIAGGGGAPEGRLLATVGILAATLLIAIDMLAIGPALPTVTAELGGVKLLFLVFCAYMVTSAVTMPLWGWLADRHGRLGPLTAGVAILVGGSVLGGLAPSMPALIAARAVQGLGAGALSTLLFTMLSDLYPLDQRAKMQGVISSVWGLASVGGPAVGGWLTETYSWRYVFWINLPLGIGALLLIRLGWRRQPTGAAPPRAQRKADWVGLAGFVALATGLMVTASLAGSRQVAWTDAAPLVGLLAAVLGAALLGVSWSRPDPFIDLSLLRRPMVIAASAVGFFAVAVLNGVAGYGPMFLQGVVRTGAKEAGFALTPMSLGWVTFSTISGLLLVRVGFRNLALLGVALLGAGAYLLTRLGPDATWLQAAGSFAVIGCGMGSMMSPLLLGVQRAVPPDRIAAATAQVQFVRSFGGALGLAVMGAVFAARVAPLERELGIPVERALLGVGALPAAQAEALRLGMAGAVGGVFTVALVAAGLAACLALLVPDLPTRDAVAAGAK